jgi:hypothetical protein
MPSSFSRARNLSSPAAFRVKVTAAIRSMGMAGASSSQGATSSTSLATRMVVLPVPAPASMRTLRWRSRTAASRSAVSGARSATVGITPALPRA